MLHRHPWPGFKYLRAVPKDLQSIEHKQAWVKCLGVIRRREAETLAHALAYEHERRIQALRAGLTYNGGLTWLEGGCVSERPSKPGA